MNFVFEDPSNLAWIALVILFAVTAKSLFNSFTPIKRRVALVTRGILVALIVLALARLSILSESRKVALVALIDTSSSIGVLASQQAVGMTPDRTRRVPANTAAYEFLHDALQTTGPEDLLGVVTFDSQARVARMPMPGPLAEQLDSIQNQSGTDIASGLKLAAAIVPQDATGRIVLFTDGNETIGDALRVSKELFLDGRPVPVDVVPLRYALPREIVVTALDVPSSAPEGGTIPLRVVIQSAVPARGVLRVTDEGNPLSIDLAGRKAKLIELAVGENVIRLEAKVAPGRIHRFEAIFEPEVDASGVMIADMRTENNRAQGFTLTPGAGATLIVRSIDAPAGTTPLERVLTEAKIGVRSITASEMPRNALEYRNYDVVIFDGVPAHEVDEDTQQLVRTFVRDMGGGFVMIGGRGSFAAGGWRGSVLQDILPVELEVPDRIVTPETATVFVLDNSGSMNHPVAGTRLTQQQVANEAVALAIRSLSPKDRIGVVVFNSDASELIELQANGDGASHAQVVRGITSDGGTNLGAGLEVARRMLESSKSQVRHIVVMTDGQSMNPESLPPLAKAIADRGVKITTIGVGDGADARGLDQIAKSGGGTYYQVRDPRVLPRIFLKAVSIERQPLVREGDFTPKVISSGSPLLLGVSPPDSLAGISLAQSRKTPNVINAMVTPEGDPLLAHWNAGLGQAVAFTSDADRWAERWKASDSYASFWTRVVRTISRSESDGKMEASAVMKNGTMEIVVDASDSDGGTKDGLEVIAAVVGADGSRREVRFSQTGPGRYEATLRNPPPGANVAMIRSNEGGAAVTGATAPSGLEFRDVTDRIDLLESIAAATGGRVLDPANAVAARFFDRSEVNVRKSSNPITSTLLIWIVAFTMLDLAVRRVAWDRWLGERRESSTPVNSEGVTTGLRAKLEPAQREDDRSITLGEEDAARLAAKARDERRARRLGQQSSPAPEAGNHSGSSPSGEADEGQSGLLAAKRRARERFEEGDDQISSP